MNNLKLFENPKFGKVRTITEDGKILFCGSDVAKTLGYKRPNDAITTHCRGTVKHRIGVQTGLKADGTPALQNIEMLFITEGDVIRLVARSPLPEAAKVESWIFDEVVPSVLHHGAYMTPATIEKILDDPDTIIQLATTLKEERQRRMELEAENERQRQAIADFEPVKRYVDTILESKASLATTQVAADYDLTANKLNKILAEEGIQRCVNGQWILLKKHMGHGYTKSKTISFTRSNGEQDTKLHTQWTQKGRMLIHGILERRGIKAVMDC